MPEERHFRAFARKAVSLPAALADASGAARPAQVVNIGLGGACVEIRGDGSTPAPGSAVTLELVSQSLWDPLLVPARITWIKTTGPDAARAGLKFQHGEPSAISALIELLGSFR